jgi:hypothetical protein
MYVLLRTFFSTIISLEQFLHGSIERNAINFSCILLSILFSIRNYFVYVAILLNLWSYPGFVWEIYKRFMSLLRFEFYLLGIKITLRIEYVHFKSYFCCRYKVFQKMEFELCSRSSMRRIHKFWYTKVDPKQ